MRERLSITMTIKGSTQHVVPSLNEIQESRTGQSRRALLQSGAAIAAALAFPISASSQQLREASS